MITNPTLPEGWTSEDLGNEQLLITSAAPMKAMITVDFRRRGYRFGLTTAGICRNEGRIEYKGRGWQQRLIAAAVMELQIADKPPPIQRYVRKR